jgi:hypothetical protein
MRYSIGPMSKNIVDAILSYSKNYNIPFTFIPSRRQIDFDRGYVNNWTTEEFCKYVRSHNLSTIKIQRDHGGPNQGDLEDDGLLSFSIDVLNMDSIHIDPWKKYPIYEDALKETIRLIQYCYSLNKDIQYEVGTEEGIRPISLEVLEQFLKDLKETLEPDIFAKIQSVVIQCGTQLLEMENIGSFDEEKLKRMLSVASHYKLDAKEHNGDWVSTEIVKKKENLGLQYINIAPEFGELETSVFLKHFRKNPADIDTFFQLCLESGRWKKWVSNDFIPEENKEKLILICGHYVFSHPAFLALKSKYTNIDKEIKTKIIRKLHSLCGIFTKRDTCIFCKSNSIIPIFLEDKTIAISNALLTVPTEGYFIPYNVAYCKECNGYMNLYLGDPEKIYSNNHIDNFGSVKTAMHEYFANFISKNTKIQTSLEVGACHDYLSRLLLSKLPTHEVYIVDPYFTGNTEGLHMISSYFEDVDIHNLSVNTVIMSSIFEHFYEPTVILEKLQKNKNIQYIYLNHPDMEYAIHNDIYINLTTEHTFFLKKSFLIQLFKKYGFFLSREEAFGHHTLCFEFTRLETSIESFLLSDAASRSDMKKYFLRLDQKIKNINTFMHENPKYEYYLWPASMHLTPLLTHGLDITKIKGFLDNSPNKIGKYFYGYNLKCFAFLDIVMSNNCNICVFLGGAPNYRKELILKHAQCRFYEI